MVFNKAKLIAKLIRQDKRFKDLEVTEQDDIINDGIKYVQDHTNWFRHFEGYYLKTLQTEGVNTIATLKNPQGVSSVLIKKGDEYTSVLLGVQINRNDNYSIGLTFDDNQDYTDFIIEVIWYYYPTCNDDIDTAANMVKLIELATFLKMYENFDDDAREAKAKGRFDEALGTNSLDLIDEFREYPMTKGLR